MHSIYERSQLRGEMSLVNRCELGISLKYRTVFLYLRYTENY